MDSGLIGLARPRRGHFDLGTGFHGDLWLDLDALFLRPSLLRPWIKELADRLAAHHIDAVCGPMEGGSFLALAIADLLGVAFLPAYRASGGGQGYRLPGIRGGKSASPRGTTPAPPTISDPAISGWRVAIADDAVNAGTAVLACTAVPEAISVPCYAAGAIASEAWPQSQCPLCAQGTPLTDPAA